MSVSSIAIASVPSAGRGLNDARWLNKWRDPTYRVQAFVDHVEHYLQGADPLDPVASPYYGDFSGFPPLYFQVGGVEAREAIAGWLADPRRIVGGDGAGHASSIEVLDMTLTGRLKRRS